MSSQELIGDEQDLLIAVQEDLQARMWTALPGIIQAVDLEKQTVSVQPAIQGVLTDADGNSKNVDLPMLVDVPLMWQKGGGFVTTIPVEPGDEVLVVFASRCIDAWWESGAVSAQSEFRMHDLSDGFALLAPTSQKLRVNNVSSSSLQIRNTAGDTYLEIDRTGKIKVKATSSVTIDATAISIKGSVSIDGSVVQSGGAFTIGGIVFGAHKHADPVSGVTGPPTN